MQLDPAQLARLGLPPDFKVGKLDPRLAEVMRLVCTHLFADFCTLRSCRRNRRCASRELLCYWALRDHVHEKLRIALDAYKRAPLYDPREREFRPQGNDIVPRLRGTGGGEAVASPPSKGGERT